jgi:hypothetical protein
VVVGVVVVVDVDDDDVVVVEDAVNVDTLAEYCCSRADGAGALERMLVGSSHLNLPCPSRPQHCHRSAVAL